MKRREFIQGAAALAAAVFAPVPKMLPRQRAKSVEFGYSPAINTYVQAQRAAVIGIDIETGGAAILEPGSYTARMESVLVSADYAKIEMRVLGHLKAHGVTVDWGIIRKLRKELT